MSSPVDLLFEGVGRGVSALAAAADPDLPEILRESEGRRLALVVRGSGRAFEVEVRDGALRVLPPRRLAPGGLAGSGGEGAGPPPPSPAAAEQHEDAGAPMSDGERAAAPARDDGEASGGVKASSRPAYAPAEADLVLAGSVPDFLRFLRVIRREPRPEDPFGRLEVHGSSAARDGFVELLRRVDPDYEALLARAAGGVVAHAVARTTLGRLNQARRLATRLVDDLAEYLEEETQLVPDPAARTRFASGVQALIGKVAELEGRLDRAQRRD